MINNSENIQKAYIKILEKELIPALGCTEPGAVAFAASKAKEILGVFPDKMRVKCSGNIIKNVKGVVVPNSGGLRGVDAAAILGLVVDGSEDALEVLENVTDDDRQKARKLLDSDFCKTELKEGEGCLYVDVELSKGKDTSQIIIKNDHTNIILKKFNDKVLFENNELITESEVDKLKKQLTVEGILKFAEEVELDKISSTIKSQIKVNMAIAEEGMLKDYGAAIGRVLMNTYGNDIKIRAKAKAAAGSDGRMGGSSLPVVINSGSGNQGITVTVPVVEYAKELKVSEEKLLRAIIISNLISIHIKSYIG
ncbi:MAG: serine dehydratase subunit alpha family protein, partial [Anaerovoracaceae bacterium]